MEIGQSAVFEVYSLDSGFTCDLDVYADNVKVGTTHIGENYSYVCDSIGVHAIYFVYNGTDRYVWGSHNPSQRYSFPSKKVMLAFI